MVPPAIDQMFSLGKGAPGSLFTAPAHYDSHPITTLSDSIYCCIFLTQSLSTMAATTAPPAAESKVPVEEPAIELNDLTFTYSGASSPVLQNITMSLPKGARCLLVGDNGAGEYLERVCGCGT